LPFPAFRGVRIFYGERVGRVNRAQSGLEILIVQGAGFLDLVAERADEIFRRGP
jgi:hypothetical protein